MEAGVIVGRHLFLVGPFREDEPVSVVGGSNTLLVGAFREDELVSVVGRSNTLLIGVLLLLEKELNAVVGGSDALLGFANVE